MLSSLKKLLPCPKIGSSLHIRSCSQSTLVLWPGKFAPEDRRSWCFVGTALFTGAVATCATVASSQNGTSNCSTSSGSDQGFKPDSTESLKQTWTKLIIVRHGETLWNAEGRTQGCTDVQLNEAGYAQARELAQAFVKLNIAEQVDAIVSSDLSRASQTADAIACVCPQAQRTADARLREFNFGDFQGKRRAEIKEPHRALHQAWKDGDLEKAAPGGGESAVQVITRGIEAFQSAAQLGSCVVIVTHGGLTKWCAVRIELGSEVANPQSFNMPKIKELLGKPVQNCCCSTVLYNHDSGAFHGDRWFENIVAEGAKDDTG